MVQADRPAVPIRPTSINTKPAFAFPDGSCDAHFHVFHDLGSYPSIPDPSYSLPTAPPERYLEIAKFFGIERMVLVQPSFYGTDNRCMVDAIRVFGDRSRGVAMIEESLPDAEWERLAKAGICAVRLDLFARASWPIHEIAAYVQRMSVRAQRVGWHVQFYTPGAVVRELLPFLETFDVDFVLDHMGYMLPGDTVNELQFDRFISLFRAGRCWAKLTGAYRIAKGRDLAIVVPLAKALIAARPDRVIWGTDWPHVILRGAPGDDAPAEGRDTGQTVNLLADWAPQEETRHRILVDNPAALFGFR